MHVLHGEFRIVVEPSRREGPTAGAGAARTRTLARVDRATRRMRAKESLARPRESQAQRSARGAGTLARSWSRRTRARQGDDARGARRRQVRARQDRRQPRARPCRRAAVRRTWFVVRGAVHAATATFVRCSPSRVLVRRFAGAARLERLARILRRERRGLVGKHAAGVLADAPCATAQRQRDPGRKDPPGQQARKEQPTSQHGDRRLRAPCPQS
jgi:hypothetical protein